MKNFRSYSAAIFLLMIGTVANAGSQAKAEKDLYPDPSKAAGDIKAALKRAGHQHKRVILDFGGNWCGDCHALDKYFHMEENAKLLKDNFILVDVNIGKVDANLDIAKKYDVPLDKGVPALAVLDSDGHLLFSQKQGEFESMRRMEPSSVTEFLNKWKG